LRLEQALNGCSPATRGRLTTAAVSSGCAVCRRFTKRRAAIDPVRSLTFPRATAVGPNVSCTDADLPAVAQAIAALRRQAADAANGD
jgi:hypothetical protein